MRTNPPGPGSWKVRAFAFSHRHSASASSDPHRGRWSLEKFVVSACGEVEEEEKEEVSAQSRTEQHQRTNQVD